jgi:hypothetical protein
MGKLTNVQITKGKIGNDTLKIDSSKMQIKAQLSAFRFIDKDTLQHIIYMPSLEISAYGETPQKAEEMLTQTINDFFDFLVSLKPPMIQQELSKLGWSNNRMFKKQFSKAFVDINGELKNLNAVDDKVERIAVVA